MLLEFISVVRALRHRDGRPQKREGFFILFIKTYVIIFQTINNRQLINEIVKKRYCNNDLFLLCYIWGNKKAL
jgi:hypothetical protein